VNKTELVSRLTTRLDGDRAKAMAAVNGVLEEIEQSLARGEKVSLFGFGTFDRRERGPRTARNPATGQTIQLGASVAPVFRAGAGLKQLLAGAAGSARTVAVSAATAVPAGVATVTAPAVKAAKKAKAGSKASDKASDKKTAKAGSGKSSKKSAGKGAKKG
jgi:DNA-binding protein HU-beta